MASLGVCLAWTITELAGVQSLIVTSVFVIQFISVWMKAENIIQSINSTTFN
jgi:hypothetical protein